MYKIFNRIYTRQLRALCALTIVGSFSVPVAAQGFKDSLLVKFFGTEAAVEKWRNSQENTYSFDHLLQGPRVAKSFNNKKFGDHLFIEGGTNLFLDMTKGTNASLGDIRPWAHFAVGDWVTPLHGWRLSLQGGQYKKASKTSKIFGGAVDYLLNINAVASEKYEKHKRFEFYGIAGLDWYSSKLEETRSNAFGLHLGLRAQAYLSPYTYLYIEPRIGAYSKKLVHANTWHKYSLASSTLAGIGYSLLPADLRKREYKTSGSFLDNTFFSLSAGPMALMNLGGISSLSNQIGKTGYLHLGKWFDPYSALRLGFGVASCKQPYADKMRAASISAGYMWNMHNTFGGYNPDRRFWLNAVADAKANLSDSGKGKDVSWGLGLGVQPNVRISKGVELFLEPRVDINTKEYALVQGASDKFDISASLFAGIAFNQGLDTKGKKLQNIPFENKTYYDHLFFDFGGSAFLPLTRGVGSNGLEHITTGGHLSIGKWLNETSGVRIWGDIAKIEDNSSENIKIVDFGADYLFNVTNMLRGYNPERTFELVASAGLNCLENIDNHSFHLGANAGLRGMARLNKFLGVYVEPQLRVYGSNVLPSESFLLGKIDMLGVMMAGMEINMYGYSPAENMVKFGKNDRKAFYSFAAGLSTTADAPSQKDNIGFTGRLSYGQWVNPVSAWRANLNGLLKPNEPYRYAMLTAGADYMIDLTTLTYGFRPSRSVSLRGIAGLNVGVDAKSFISPNIHFVSDFHIGTQLAVAVGQKNEIYVEPQGSYILGGKPTTNNDERLMASVMLGVNHKVTPLGGSQVRRNADFESETAYDHMFVDFGVGGTFPITSTIDKNISTQMGPSVYAGVGKWFNALSGIRLWSDYAIFKDSNTSRIDAIDFGLDYMFNLTNAFRGYDPQRRVEILASAGLNGTSHLQNGKLFVGGNVGLKSLWHVNDLLGLYIEPQARFYESDALPTANFAFGKFDMMASMLAGVQFTMNGYRPGKNVAEYEEDERHSFVSVAAGLGTSAEVLSLPENYGFAGRLSYGKWFTPISALRFNLNNFTNTQDPFSYVQLSAGLDYMSDLTAMSYGYNPDRAVSVRAVGGFNVGADYKPHTKDDFRFMADVHFGGQLAVALGGNNEIYVEPQLSYRIAGCRTYDNIERVEPKVLLGLNHKLNSYKRKSVVDVDDKQNDFVSISLGTGLHSQTLASQSGMDKFTKDFDIAYGHWFNSLSGYRLGMSTTNVKQSHMKTNVLSFHADYMINMLNLSGNDAHKDTDWVLNGLLGVNMGIGCVKNMDKTYAVGAQLGVEVGYKVSPEWEIFVEPTGVAMSKNIWKYNGHPVVVQGRLMLGTKYCF